MTPLKTFLFLFFVSEVTRTTTVKNYYNYKYALLGFAAAFTVEQETNLVRQQLGYIPHNFVSVSAWTLTAADKDTTSTTQTVSPVAIKTYPLHGGAKRRQAKAGRTIKDPIISSPFPTLYWLCCPEISRAVAELERRGYIQQFESKLREDPALCRRLRKCHEEYALDRWNSLTEEDRMLLCEDNDPAVSRMRIMMQYSGISGTNFTKFDNNNDDEDDVVAIAPIKCLHAHYAHYRSTVQLSETAPSSFTLSEISKNPVGEMIHEQLRKEYPDLQL